MALMTIHSKTYPKLSHSTIARCKNIGPFLSPVKNNFKIVREYVGI